MSVFRRTAGFALSAAHSLAHRSSASRAWRVTVGLVLVAAVYCGSLFAAAPSALASMTCGTGADTDGVTATYSGTWTYTDTAPQSGGPNVVQHISLSWSESFDGTTDCWTLLSDGGSASLSGVFIPPNGPDPNCQATLGLGADAASNFQSNQAEDASGLDLSNPVTGIAQTQFWYVDENVPFYSYGEPEGLLQSSDSNPNDWCSQPFLSGIQPIAATPFTGPGCHFQGSGSGSVDFLSFPVNGGETQTDDCSYNNTDDLGDTTQETLQQSVTLSSSTPHCSDVSASSVDGAWVTFKLPCTSKGGQPLDYTISQPKQVGGEVERVQGNQVTWGPASHFSGTSTFTFDAFPEDGVEDGLAGNTATATITVCCPPCSSAKAPNASAASRGVLAHEAAFCPKVVIFLNGERIGSGAGLGNASKGNVVPGQQIVLDAEVFGSFDPNPTPGTGEKLDPLNPDHGWQGIEEHTRFAAGKCMSSACALASYEATVRKAEIKPLEAGALVPSRDVKMYWTNPVSQSDTQIDIHYDGKYEGKPLTGDATLVIQGAKSSKFAATLCQQMGMQGDTSGLGDLGTNLLKAPRTDNGPQQRMPRQVGNRLGGTG